MTNWHSLATARGVACRAGVLGFEIGNVCIKKIRRNPDVRDQAPAALKLYLSMVIRFADTDLARVVTLADKSGLTAYDASYLWLARQLNAELVTLDRRLDAAAKQASIG